MIISIREELLEGIPYASIFDYMSTRNVLDITYDPAMLIVDNVGYTGIAVPIDTRENLSKFIGQQFPVRVILEGENLSNINHGCYIAEKASVEQQCIRQGFKNYIPDIKSDFAELLVYVLHHTTTDRIYINKEIQLPLIINNTSLI